MSLELKPGMKLLGAACTSEFVVVKAPAATVDVRIGGHSAVTTPEGRTAELAVTTPSDRRPAMGKRYVDAAESIELLCTKVGDGAPALGDEILVQKDAKALPASD
jgi:hypothetical protein